MIIGGTGLVGRAAARRLIASGWDVVVIARDPGRLPRDLAAAGVTFHSADRRDLRALRAAYGDGADLLVDCICFTAADARRLVPLARDAGSTVMISSKVVYADAAGNHPGSHVAPRFARPIRETDATVAPARDTARVSPATLGAHKIAAEHVLLDSDARVTVLRPSKVHGEGASAPREWVFVKRVLDGRPAVFLAKLGRSRDHTSAAVNIAALIETVAANPGRRILNSADPDAPTSLQISRAIAAHLGHAWDEVRVGNENAELGRTPWDTEHPIVLDTTASEELGYIPVGDYAATVTVTVDWLVKSARAGEPLPGADHPYLGAYLDYTIEDEYLATRRKRVSRVAERA